MLAVTGGTRGGLERLGSDPLVQSMAEGDFLVILGDSGVFEPRTDFRENARRFKELSCTVLFLEGSTDDYDEIDDQPSFTWNGGLVNNVSRGVMRLCRGAVFAICGKKILAFGGASTPGRDEAGKYYSWWPEQDPDDGDVERAMESVRMAGGRVDYILSCDCPEKWKPQIPGALRGLRSGMACDRLLSEICFGHWYFSNLHSDTGVSGAPATCVDRRVVRLC